MAAGWFPDPTGRFAARYHDGDDWTDRVQGGDGQVTDDVLERRRSSGLAAPTPVGADAAPPASAAAPYGGAPGWPAPGPPTALAKGTGVLGVAIAGLGWLLAAVSLLALDWGDGVSRGDIADALPSSLPDGLPFTDVVAFLYVQWAGLALLVLVALGIGAVALGLVGRDPTVLRTLVAAGVLVAALVHAVAVARALRDAIELGAHVGTVGYLVVLAGLAIGSHTRRPT